MFPLAIQVFSLDQFRLQFGSLLFFRLLDLSRVVCVLGHRFGECQLILLIIPARDEIHGWGGLYLCLLESEPELAELHIHIAQRGFLAGLGLEDLIVGSDDLLLQVLDLLEHDAAVQLDKPVARLDDTAFRRQIRYLGLLRRLGKYGAGVHRPQLTAQKQDLRYLSSCHFDDVRGR